MGAGLTQDGLFDPISVTQTTSSVPTVAGLAAKLASKDQGCLLTSFAFSLGCEGFDENDWS